MQEKTLKANRSETKIVDPFKGVHAGHRMHGPPPPLLVGEHIDPKKLPEKVPVSGGT